MALGDPRQCDGRCHTGCQCGLILPPAPVYWPYEPATSPLPRPLYPDDNLPSPAFTLTPFPPAAVPQGWQCPCCRKVNAPTVPQCPCSP